MTDTGKPKVDEATLSEMRNIALKAGNEMREECRDVYPFADITEVVGPAFEGVLLVPI